MKPVDFSNQSEKIVVLQGNNLWQIARELYDVGTRYTAIFQENQDQIADPDLIYPGQVLSLPE